jgi:hypothetical protein
VDYEACELRNPGKKACFLPVSRRHDNPAKAGLRLIRAFGAFWRVKSDVGVDAGAPRERLTVSW